MSREDEIVEHHFGVIENSRQPFIRKPYNYDADAVSLQTGLSCCDESLASQEFRDEVDINTIAQRFGLFGEMPTDVRAPQYGDYEGVHDYHSALNAIAEARESFEAMPAHVRARFNNDPGAFVDFCSQPENREEMSKLGLTVKAAELVSGESAARSDQSLLDVTGPGDTKPS